MRSAIVAAAVVLVQASLSGASFAAGDPVCAGEACGALAVSSDGCAWTNKGDKSVRVAVTAASDASPMVTILAAGETFKEPADRCSKSTGNAMHYEASFPALAKMPDEVAAAPVKPAVAVPKAKPVVPAVPAVAAVKDETIKAAVVKHAMAASSTATAAAVASATAPATAIQVAAVMPTPRVKPAPPPIYPPLPRVKPAAPVQVALATPAATGPAATGPAAIAPPASAPVEEDSGRLQCGEACNEILFKVVDSCLWVQSQNPRPIAFEATVGGKPVVLALEGADGKKADVRAAILAKAGADVAKGDAAYHTRLHDPFQSAGSGIPVYRARLGSGDSCVKSRDEIARFSARFAK